MKKNEKKISLYFYPGTRADKVKWLLEELEITYELKFVDLSKGEHKTETYLNIHPLGKVPVLKIGNKVIFETMAICLYLDLNFLPEDHLPNRASYYQWMALSIGTLEPAILEQRRQFKAKTLNMNAIDMGPVLTPLSSVLHYINNTLGDRLFILGRQFTTADIMLGSLLMNAEDMEVFNHLDHIKNWLKELRNRPAYQRAVAK